MNQDSSHIQRNSSIELLRIIIMFMVLLMHANFKAFDSPHDYSWIAVSRSFLEAVSLIAVNVFVLISGYFGLDFKVKKVLKLLFMTFFAVVPVSFVLYLSGYCSDYSFKTVLFNFDFIGAYWFILAYLVLLCFSPILNKSVEGFVEDLKSDPRNWNGGGNILKNSSLLVVFLFFYFLIGILGQNSKYHGIGVDGGYSAIWFIFLYLIGRSLYFGVLKTWPVKRLLIVFSICVLFETVFLLVFGFMGAKYNNPFILVASICFFMLFTRFYFYNRFVNKIAASATMVYLINDHPLLSSIYHDQLVWLCDSNGLFSFSLTALVLMLCWFVFAVLYDQVRLFLWGVLSSCSRERKP